ncbi:hypothetical protein HHK36_013302 [Tetracentron sinense]|uniref:C2H2-type domain-containing protein n=1 Tax=Tetracentron sinense TaxID=13715 RepID=A0A835DF97_TETSI|nr:hypothetical protein HHK36_013302 [Tetracentron sinense]
MLINFWFCSHYSLFTARLWPAWKLRRLHQFVKIYFGLATCNFPGSSENVKKHWRWKEKRRKGRFSEISGVITVITVASADLFPIFVSVIPEEIDEHRVDISGEKEKTKPNTCEECGASFRKPAYLKQHMQSHSFEREALDPTFRTPKCEEEAFCTLIGPVPGWGISCEAPSSEPQSRTISLLRGMHFTCPIDDCHSSYRRIDHLTRHLLQHQGKLFICPVENCNRNSGEGPKQHVCQEIGCGKAFKFASKLRKHEDSHVKLDSVEAICSELGCMKHFTDAQCLKAHLQSRHQYITCEVCGTKQLKKNIKLHMRTHEAHEAGGLSERIKCSFKGCLHTFSTQSNLNQHMKAVHLEVRPFACSIPECSMRFPYRHVRDKWITMRKLDAMFMLM